MSFQRSNQNLIPILDSKLSRTEVSKLLPVDANYSTGRFNSCSSCFSSLSSSIGVDDYDDDEYEDLSSDGYGTDTQSSYQSLDNDMNALLKVKRNIKSDLQKLSLLPSTDPMEIKYHELAIRAIDILIASPKHRVVIAIGGTPGSGKSTLSSKVTSILNNYFQPTIKKPCNNHTTPVQCLSNDLSKSFPDPSEYYSKYINDSSHYAPTFSAITNFALSYLVEPSSNPATLSDDNNLDELDLGLSMDDLNFKKCSPAVSELQQVDFATTVTLDGYHLTRAQLDQFEDPVEAHKRRGSPWTFDAQGVVDMAKSLYNSCISKTRFYNDSHFVRPKTLSFPSFDHALKDPTPDGIQVDFKTRVVFLEGLYTLYNKDPWNQIVSYVDDSWMISVDLDVSTTRLAKRHLKAGIVDTLEAGIERVKVNDELNARLILNNHITPKVMINSVSS